MGEASGCVRLGLLLYLQVLQTSWNIDHVNFDLPKHFDLYEIQPIGLDSAGFDLTRLRPSDIDPEFP